jgi:hypothetical protein
MKVDITVLKKRREPERVPRGLIEDEQQDEVFSRRVRQTRLNFYDLGQIEVGGVWKDSITDVGTRVVPEINPGELWVTLNLEEFGLVHWQQVHSKLFEVPLSNWKNKYRKIEHAEAYKYGLVYYKPGSSTPNFLTEENTDWTSEGLEPYEKIRVQSIRIALDFDLRDSSRYKVTKSYDYNAADEEITLSGGADIFLMPEMYYFLVSHDNDYGGSPYFVRFGYYLPRWGVSSRELLLEKTGYSVPHQTYEGLFPNTLQERYLHNNTGTFQFNRYTTTNPLWHAVGNTSFMSDSFRDEWTEYVTSRFSDPLYVVIEYTDGGLSAVYLTEPNFPNTDGAEYARDFWMDSPLPDRIYLGEGLLVAIIKLGSTFYYVWRKDSPIPEEIDNAPFQRFSYYDLTF